MYMKNKKIILAVTLVVLIILPSVESIENYLPCTSEKRDQYICQFLPLGFKKIRILFRNLENHELEGNATIYVENYHLNKTKIFNRSFTILPREGISVVTLRIPLLTLLSMGNITVHLFVEDEIPQAAWGFFIFGFIRIRYVTI